MEGGPGTVEWETGGQRGGGQEGKRGTRKGGNGGRVGGMVGRGKEGNALKLEDMTRSAPCADHTTDRSRWMSASLATAWGPVNHKYSIVKGTTRWWAMAWLYFQRMQNGPFPHERLENTLTSVRGEVLEPQAPELRLITAMSGFNR